MLTDESAICFFLVTISIFLNSAAGKFTFKGEIGIYLSAFFKATITPFVIFSYVNLLTFAKTKLAIQAIPQGRSLKSVTRQLLIEFTKTFQSRILILVAYFEALVIIPLIILSALRGQASLVIAFIYIKLFTFRYACSVYLRMAYNDISKVLNALLDGPYSPKIVSMIYKKTMGVVASLCDTGISQSCTSCR